MNRLFRFLAVFGFALFGSVTQAQVFPSKPIALIK